LLRSRLKEKVDAGRWTMRDGISSHWPGELKIEIEIKIKK